jgi:hypothetical protein
MRTSQETGTVAFPLSITTSIGIFTGGLAGGRQKSPRLSGKGLWSVVYCLEEIWLHRIFVPSLYRHILRKVIEACIHPDVLLVHDPFLVFLLVGKAAHIRCRRRHGVLSNRRVCCHMLRLNDGVIRRPLWIAVWRVQARRVAITRTDQTWRIGRLIGRLLIWNAIRIWAVIVPGSVIDIDWGTGCVDWRPCPICSRLGSCFDTLHWLPNRASSWNFVGAGS